DLSLREAIEFANKLPGADLITFDNSIFGTPQVISLTLGTELAVTDSLTIQGPGAGLLTVSGANACRVFNINGPGILNVTISGMTIADGHTASGPSPASTFGDGAGIQIEDEIVTLNNVVVTNNSSAGEGGGIGTGFSASLTIQNSTISGNKAGSAG